MPQILNCRVAASLRARTNDNPFSKSSKVARRRRTVTAQCRPSIALDGRRAIVMRYGTAGNAASY